MLSRIFHLFQIVELRTRLFYTLALLAVYRAGIFVTAPGIDRTAMKNYLQASQGQGGGFLNLFNFFSGGALENASIFALGIMPYVTSSIIFSLLGVVMPTIERLQKEGEQGRRKINQYTRYGTVLIAVMQSIMISNYLKIQSFNGQAIVNQQWAAAWGGMGFVLMMVITLTAGTAFIMWLGERITERGIGNGMSLIIFAGIVARLPAALYVTFVGLREQTYQAFEIVILSLAVLVALMGVVFMERGQRRIPVQYAKKIVDKKEYGGQATHLPIKINIAGVIPPIFAQTVLSFPATLASLLGLGFLEAIQRVLMIGSWPYEVLFVTLVIFFAYFYTAVQFNPVDVADNLRKFGGFIPGVRPGKATADYIDFVLNHITFAGALYLSAVCVSPFIFQNLTSNQMPFYFGGTGLLIVVNVALETFQQIEGHFIAKRYENFGEGELVRIRAREKIQESENLSSI